MALNLWKLEGKPTSYNPLPINWGNSIYVGIGDYIVRFKAKSPSGASIRVTDNGAINGQDFNTTIVLTTEFTFHEVDCKSTAYQQIYLYDANSVGDIDIIAIELIEKPLQTLTLNGVSGEVGDWESGTGNGVTASPDSTRIRLKDTFPLLPNTTYTKTVHSDYESYIFFYDKNMVTLSGVDAQWTTTTFITPTTAYYARFIVRKKSLGNIETNEVGVINPIVNMGSIPVPYEKKRGDRMVLPTAKKNMFDGSLESGYYLNGVKSASPSSVRSINSFPVVGGKTYTVSVKERNIIGNCRITQYNTALAHIRNDLAETITVDQSTAFVTFHFGNNVTSVTDLVQLEEGTVATPHEAFTAQLNPKPQRSTFAKQGLVMDGTSNYIQLPSMTMDSIEIDCLVNKSGGSGSKYIVDPRIGMMNGHANISGFGPDVKFLYVDDVLKTNFPSNIPDNQRTKLKFVWDAFTDDVTIFARFNDNPTRENAKGVLYGAKCFLNGEIVAEYDFTNPTKLVGDKVLQSSDNLIPSFEDDGHWNLHVNTKIYGEDVMRLNATASTQTSDCTFDVKPNTTYLFNMLTPGSNSGIVCRDADNGTITYITSQANDGLNKVFTTLSTTTRIYVRLFNYSVTTGTFDFIKPQMHELKNEGTLIGSPTPLVRASKRTLYNKR